MTETLLFIQLVLGIASVAAILIGIGRVLQKLEDHIVSDNLRFEDQGDRIDKLEERMWGHRSR